MNIRNRLTALLLGSMLGMLLLACSQQPPERDAGTETEGKQAAETVQQPVPGRVARDASGPATSYIARGKGQLQSEQALAMPQVMPPHWPAAVDRENYQQLDDNPVHRAGEDPVSTFSVDVDTGAYANLRRLLNAGRLPPQDAVRIEEMLNYFDYDYAPAQDPEQPFATHVTLARAPWDERKGLLRIGLKGYEVSREQRKPANLVFLVDVSGSMQSPDKLELLKRGLGLLATQLDAADRVSLVVYAGASGVVLQPTPGNQAATIRAALAQLAAAGSTNGAAGIRLAYDMARQAYIEDGINRVILATDGDFNVGTVNFEDLVDLVERERKSGITLTTLGFGSGNYNDHLMEQLADKGNGNHGYIDTIREANKLLVEEMTSTLQVIASDVKAQVEFNPAVVEEYRLVGYENRMLAREDFNNDQVDAGEIGAGHSVTALYEIVFRGSGAQWMDPLRYRNDRKPSAGGSDELGFLKLRYKLPGEDHSRLLELPLASQVLPLAETDADFRFAAAVAAFGQRLRGGKYGDGYDYADIRALASSGRGEDAHGYRGEFIGLVTTAESLASMHQAGR